MKYRLYKAPFSRDFTSDFISTALEVFSPEADQAWFDALAWRLDNMPDMTVFTAYKKTKLIGFKAGYASAHNRYYSWLGGVNPDFRRQNIARTLMERQHKWLYRSRFQLLETQVAERNAPMIALNHICGFTKTGSFLKDGAPYLVMQKFV